MVENAPRGEIGEPDVRVGIVSWNTEALLARCLASLPAALGDLRAEVVVVDNASSDGSSDMAQAHAGVTVRTRTANAGYAVAMNDALDGSAAPILLALNPDTELPPGAIARLVTELARHPDTGLVVPALVGTDGRPQRSTYPYPGVVAALEVGFAPPALRRSPTRARRRRRTGGAGVAVGANAGADVGGPLGGIDEGCDLGRQWAVGAVHCIRAAALAGEPPYTDRWFMYGEDIELCWRLRQGGWRLRMLTDVAVVHHGNAAGRQRWGEGATLELRSLPSIYDWLWSARSPVIGRATAAVNVAGLATKGLALRLAGITAGRGAAGQRAQWERRAAELSRLRRYHAAVVRHGPFDMDAQLPAPRP